MSLGKSLAQVSHASLALILNRMKGHGIKNGLFLELPEGSAIKDWIEGSFTKVVLAVDSEESLLKVYEAVQKAGLPCVLITDSGKTEFDGVPTHTVVGIGPERASLIDPVTGKDSELWKSKVLVRI